MRVMLLAFGAAAVISVGAWYALGQAGFGSAERQSAPDSVRLD